MSFFRINKLKAVTKNCIRDRVYILSFYMYFVAKSKSFVEVTKKGIVPF